MYELKDFEVNQDFRSSFTKIMKNKWDEIHSTAGVFRYSIKNLQERIIEGNYLILLNPDRGSNRRTPEDLRDIRQRFDDSKFNFTKVSQKEVMFSINHDEEEHILLVNVSPISKYHTLLCPSLNKKLPQVVTKQSLSLVTEIMFCARDSDLKIAFNSMCAFASVNHLHYHLLIVNHSLPVELQKWKHLKNSVHVIEDYPAPAFCFEVNKSSLHIQTKEIYKLTKYFIDNSIAHNIILAMRSNNVVVYIWPRKSTSGVKNLTHFNVAALELSGWCTVYSTESFKAVEREVIDKELSLWKMDDFRSLCKEVENLYSF